jgi:hypothetical protein
VEGGVEANGNNGENSPCDGGGGGGGSGGSIYLSATDLILNDGLVQAVGGAAGLPGHGTWRGGAGGFGRIRLDYTTLSGNTNPAPGYGQNVTGTVVIVTSNSPKPVGEGTPITLTVTVQNQDGLPIPNEPVEL